MAVNVLALQEKLFDRIQQKRADVALPEIRDTYELGSRERLTACQSLKLHFSVPESERDSVGDYIRAQVQGYLDNPGALEPSQSAFFSSVLLGEQMTHLGFDFSLDEEVFEAVLTLKAYNFYFDVEPPGPMIDGDLVLQGYGVSEQYGPSLVVVSVVQEEDAGAEETGMEAAAMYREISTVLPSRMMVESAAERQATDETDRDERTKYLIPVSIDSEYRDKKLEIKIFVQAKGDFSYEADDETDYASFESRAKMIESNVIRTGENTSSGDFPDALQDMVASEFPSDKMGTDYENENDTNNNLQSSDNSVRMNNDDASAKLSRASSIGANTSRKISTHSSSKLNTASSAEPFNEFEDNAQSDLIVKEIHVAHDYDDLLSLQEEGFQLLCTAVTKDGPVGDQDHLWKFHVLASYGPSSEPGLEDVMWVKCLKSLGTLPTVPFFRIMHDHDLSGPDEDYSVYLATKTGVNAKFKRVVMLSSAYEDTELLEKYVSKVTGVYRPAPQDITNAFGGNCGLLLMVSDENNNCSSPTALSAAGAMGTSTRSVTGETAGSSHKRAMGSSRKVSIAVNPNRERERANSAESEEEDSDLDDDDDDDDYDDTEDVLRGLEEQVQQLESEKLTLSTLNAELQKKAVALMTREKALQGQAMARTEMANTLNGTQNVNADGTTNDGLIANQTAQDNIEKEKPYHDTLQLIVEERNKLNKQLKEFDQLALDLQTRLDDKEFKAKSIATSFKQFKKEILSKAENSRTGHAIPKVQMQQIELSEAKHEEDLEKVRLRHISLKTLQKKLERTLRAREQLAEGLHMIDFEQLKIENQTLNEKIEERNEELAKLKRKKTTTVQVLTHIREKLHFLLQVKEREEDILVNLQTTIADSRNAVTLAKLERDVIRNENKEYKAKQGFASSDLLLLDFEKRKHCTEELQATILELKSRHDILVRQVNSVQHFTAGSLASAGSGNVKGTYPLPLAPSIVSRRKI